ncbi:MAG: hypothetical protein MPJ22_07680 [Pirellulales bacterium]|nr:hypothetical protein [Pirellulales bacterium]
MKNAMYIIVLALLFVVFTSFFSVPGRLALFLSPERLVAEFVSFAARKTYTFFVGDAGNENVPSRRLMCKTSKERNCFERSDTPGNWVFRFDDGDEPEDPIVDGEKYSHWYVRPTTGEGPVVKGKPHGHWVMRTTDGTVAEGPMVNGMQHGRWILRYANGVEAVVMYENGQLGELIEPKPDQ